MNNVLCYRSLHLYILTLSRLLSSLTVIIIVWLFIAASSVLAETVTSPQTCRVGIYVASLRDLNLAEKQFSTDFYLWSVCPSKELQPLPSMKVLNIEDFQQFRAAYDSTLPSKQEKAAVGKRGFVPAVARWVIERSNAWMERCKSLVKNFERTLAHATTKINLCFIRLMLKRLAATS